MTETETVTETETETVTEPETEPEPEPETVLAVTDRYVAVAINGHDHGRRAVCRWQRYMVDSRGIDKGFSEVARSVRISCQV